MCTVRILIMTIISLLIYVFTSLFFFSSLFSSLLFLFLSFLSLVFLSLPSLFSFLFFFWGFQYIIIIKVIVIKWKRTLEKSNADVRD